MAPCNSHPIQPDDEAPPSYIVFAKVKDGTHLEESISSFWSVIVIREEMMADDLMRARSAGPKYPANGNKGGEYCAVWVIGKARL